MFLAIPSRKCLAHSIVDGIPLKTDKATLTKILESKQETVLTDSNILPIKATVIDGDIMLHETVLKHSKSTYAMMARDLLVKICSCHGEQVHLVLDKYQYHPSKMLSVTCVIQVLPKLSTLLGPTKPSDKVVQNCFIQRSICHISHGGMEETPVWPNPWR